MNGIFIQLNMQNSSRFQPTRTITQMITIEELISQFKAERFLNSDPQTKTLAILGSIGDEHAIVTIEKSAFGFVDVSTFKLEKVVETIKLINNNDIYYWSQANLSQNIDVNPGAKVNVIYPATETHIKKYSDQVFHYITETPEVYNGKVKAYIETQKGDRIKWVHNILYHGKESETFVHHDKDPQNGFVLLPDMKWDHVTMNALYLVVIVNRTDIASVRDLNGSHIKFLENLQETVKSITSSKFPVPRDQLRVFIHYQPSYYHFHIHVVSTSHAGLGNGINVGKAILLDDVIENIKIAPDYYQKRTLYYTLGENHDLWKVLNE